MDEVNHVNMVVSFVILYSSACLLSFVILYSPACLLLSFMMMMCHKGLLFKEVKKFIFADFLNAL